MLNQTMEFSEDRGTWNLFVNGEWYFEGSFEQCSDMMANNAADYYEDEYYEEPLCEEDFI